MNRPVSDLLGGAVRKSVAYGGYLFFKFAKPADRPDAMVREAQQMVAQHGVKSLKLKGGVPEPDLEAETMVNLRKVFPHHPLRIDPMCAWTVKTSIRMAWSLAGVLQFLEDPAKGMTAVSAFSLLPLATNLVVLGLPQIIEAIRKNAVLIILSDHHY